MDKEEAVEFILKVLASKMAMTSVGTRDKAFKAAEEHNISALELLRKLQDLVWKI